MSTDTVTLVGEGGVKWEFDLPLGEVYADQVKAGKLLPVDEDARDAVAYLLTAAAEAPDDGAGSQEPPSLADRIAAVSSHAEANALADELGVEGFDEKKPALDAKRAALTAAAEAPASE